MLKWPITKGLATTVGLAAPISEIVCQVSRSWMSDCTSSVMLPRRVVHMARRADGMVVLTVGLLKDTVMSTRMASGRT